MRLQTRTLVGCTLLYMLKIKISPLLSVYFLPSQSESTSAGYLSTVFRLSYKIIFYDVSLSTLCCLFYKDEKLRILYCSYHTSCSITFLSIQLNVLLFPKQHMHEAITLFHIKLTSLLAMIPLIANQIGREITLNSCELDHFNIATTLNSLVTGTGPNGIL